MNEKKVKNDLQNLINKNSIGAELNCADFIIANYLYESLVSLDKAFRLDLISREEWTKNLKIGGTPKEIKNG
jgi:hypothetical protein